MSVSINRKGSFTETRASVHDNKTPECSEGGGVCQVQVQLFQMWLTSLKGQLGVTSR